MMRGLCIIGYDFTGGFIKRHHLEKIKEWGFDTILITAYWVESETPQGEYREDVLRKYDEGIRLIKDVGLKVILSLRVCFNPNWEHFATHDYVNLTSEGRERYARFLQMIVRRYDCDMYCLWHYPYHMQTQIDSQRYNAYYNTTFPRLLEAVREHTTKPIIFTPIHQGGIQEDESSRGYLDLDPIPDSNIVYGLGHMIPWYVSAYGHWNYDHNQMTQFFSGIKKYREDLNLPMMSIEYAPLHWKIGEGIHQSRLDCLKASLEKMQHYGVDWLFWSFSIWRPNDDNILQDVESLTPTPVLNLLHEYMGISPPDEEFPWKWVALLAGVIAIIYFMA